MLKSKTKKTTINKIKGLGIQRRASVRHNFILKQMTTKMYTSVITPQSRKRNENSMFSS